jgi:transposase
MDATTVAVDLAKDVFEVALANRAGRIVERKRLTRPQFERFIDGLTPETEVVMEACGTAHYWGRRCQARQLRVRLLPGQYVRPYVRRNKTDRTDTEAVLEANRCSGVNPVPVKTVDQQTLQVLHRVRTQWQAARTARINAMRGILREFGFPIGVGARKALRCIPALLEDATIALPDLVRHTVARLLHEVRDLEDRIGATDQQLTRVVRAHPVARRLHQIPGVGVITATALVGAVRAANPWSSTRSCQIATALRPRVSASAIRSR